MAIGMSVYLRYFMVLIQEMDLKLDLGFVYALLDLFTPENASITSSEQEVSHRVSQWYINVNLIYLNTDCFVVPLSVGGTVCEGHGTHEGRTKQCLCC